MANYQITNGISISACLFLLNNLVYIPFTFSFSYHLDYHNEMFPQELIIELLPNLLQVLAMEISKGEASFTFYSREIITP